MPKSKKTRKQKMLADVRRRTEPKTAHSAPVEPLIKEHTVAPAPAASVKQPTRNIVTEDYKYLKHDLLKTISLTCSIVAIELLIKYGTGI